MELERYFNLNAKALFTEAKTKSDLLMEIARSATSSTPALEKFDPVRLHKKLMERESIGSTGFGDEIAIPHCSLDDIDTFVVGVVISKEGIDFKAMDGKPVKLFMYIIGPRKKRNEHIRILSEISKVLRIPANISALLEEKSVKSFFNKFSEFGSWDKTDELTKEYTQITIHIQDSHAFEKILELITEVKDCNVSVIEGNNISKYLYSMPLFSHFMNDHEKGFHRLIIAVLNTIYINDIIRKVNAVLKELKCESNTLITTHALSYFNGGLDI
jgi:mannitol/fructose-specific phosphotransferase system IIA component (Ntr-type)